MPSPQETEMLDLFFKQMTQEMSNNSHKGNMAVGWHPNAYTLIAETAYHIAKLNKAMLEVEREQRTDKQHLVSEYAADVGNLMAKVSLTFGTLELTSSVGETADDS